MPTYHIESKHDKATCDKVMDEFASMPDADRKLNQFEWGCDAGVHKAWATVDARNEQEARSQLPPSLQKSADVTEVKKHSARNLRSMHG